MLHLRQLRIIRNKYFGLNYRISTELIKKQQAQLMKNQINPSLQNYPKTFEEKAIILNSPRTIQLLQVVQFGVKFKKSNKWFPLLILGAALFGYILEKMLPIRVNDRYFMISPQASHYPTGYFFAAINFQQPFYLYLPVFLCLGHVSKFISIPHLSYLMAVNMIVGSILGKYIVDKRIQSYEVWNNQHLCHGQGCLLSTVMAFCTLLGPINSFVHLKSKIGLQTIPGLGIIRRGVPIGMVVLFYISLNSIAAWKGQIRNHEVISADLLTGIIFGLLLRKFRPII